MERSPTPSNAGRPKKSKNNDEKTPEPGIGSGVGTTTSAGRRASTEHSEPITPQAYFKLFHQQALLQIDACQGLLTTAQMIFEGPESGFETSWLAHAQDWIDSAGAKYACRLRGEFEAFHRLARDHDREDVLMPAHEAVLALLTDARLARAWPAPAWADTEIPNVHEAAFELCQEARRRWDYTRHVPIEGPARRYQLAGRDFLDWWRSKVGDATPKDILNALVREYQAALMDLEENSPGDWMRTSDVIREFVVSANALRTMSKRHEWPVDRHGPGRRERKYRRSDIESAGWVRRQAKK